MTPPMVEARGLFKRFTLPRHSLFAASRTVTAVEGVSFAIPAGTTFGVVGESGSGKTTLARMLLKLEQPSEGQLLVNDQDIFAQTPAEERAYRRLVQAVFQDPYGALSPRMRAGAIVTEPLRALGVHRRAADMKAAEVLELVGMRRDAASRYPHEFSGGQRQRIAIARALSVDPRLLVLDEPVSALDVSVRAQVLALLREMQQRLGLTYLFIGHDLAVVRYLSDAVGVMYFGRMVEIGPARDVLRRPAHPYTRRLVALAAAEAPLGVARLGGGTLPNPLSPPSGCHFRTRCAFADARCAADAPALREIAPGHNAACHHLDAIAAGTKAETGPLLEEASRQRAV
jgi:oligopeptide/dipeptide ABC transporter ATP-binding protein